MGAKNFSAGVSENDGGSRPKKRATVRSAVIHDWLVSTVGGGEKCLEAIVRSFPSPIYTLLKSEKKLLGTYFESCKITSSCLQKIPRIEAQYRNYLPLFPWAIERFDLSAFDLILSSSHCVAKGVMTNPEQLHICYCYTPVRYAWDLRDDYLKESRLDRGLQGALVKYLLRRLRNWDALSSKRVDHFIAISHYVAGRIKRFYGREACVIYPPVDLAYYKLEEKKDDYYVAASRFVPYKKMKLIVEAFSQMPDRKLIVIGDGPEWKKVKEAAASNVELLGYQSDEVLRYHLQKAKAFVFAALEDFGILPIEAMGCGTPVIALGEGAVRETVVEAETGLFFNEQTVSSLIDGVKRFERLELDPKKCRARAELFSQERFNREFKQFVIERWSEFQARK
jgi:glycosyltransferase involved in cell wall biosynthesis